MPMPKRTAAVVWMVVAVLAGFVPADAADLDSGFLGTNWASPPTALKGFTQVGGSGKVAYYADPQRAYTFFGIEVPNQVVYGFYDDKFFAVYIDVNGVDIFYRIKSYIQKKYGPPSKTSREARENLTTYIWRTRQAQIKFKHYETSGEMKIGLYYQPVAAQVNADRQKSLEVEPPKILSPISPNRPQETLFRDTEIMDF